jgi:SAM-dependent methyltransferase
MSDVNAAVAAHYGDEGLTERILDALQRAGVNLDALTPDDLKPLDQFHIGGQPATRAQAELAGITAGMRVLDVGGGIGGPARTLASDHDCHVTVLDLSAEFCRTGALLTERTGFGDRVVFRQGDAQAMPFPDGAFDLVWTQHSSMNMPDKGRLYAEIARVLRPGGRLSLHEVIAGTETPVRFPVPWARDPAQSFLLAADELRALLADRGFREIAWHDETASSAAWFRATQERAAGSAPPVLGIHVLFGDSFAEMGRNLLRNMDEGRIRVVRAVLDRP